MSDSNHVLVKSAEQRRVLGGISRPHHLKLLKIDPDFPEPVWIQGTRFFWLDKTLDYIALCQKRGAPIKPDLRRKRRAALCAAT